MGVGVLVLAFIGLLLLIGSPFSYFPIKYLGYKKAGIVVAVLMASVVLIPFFLFYFESELYSKADVRKDLAKLNITLKNEISGMPEYYQFTDLKISQEDKQKIINEIKNSGNFEKRDSMYPLRFLEINQNIWKKDTTILHNYQFENQFIREIYIKEQNFVPINIQIETTENSDILKLERVED